MYAGQEATVRTGHGTTDCFKHQPSVLQLMGSQSQHDQATEKQQLVFTLVFSCLELAENRQGCILSPCLFNLYAEYIMRNAGLEEAQAGSRLLYQQLQICR